MVVTSDVRTQIWMGPNVMAGFPCLSALAALSVMSHASFLCLDCAPQQAWCPGDIAPASRVSLSFPPVFLLLFLAISVGLVTFLKLLDKAMVENKMINHECHLLLASESQLSPMGG